MPTQRLGRAATFAFGAAIATSVAGCGTASMPGNDAGGVVPLYGAPMGDSGPVDSGLLAMYGGPPIDAGNDAGGNVGPAYGAPVIDGGVSDVDMGTSNADYGGPPHT